MPPTIPPDAALLVIDVQRGHDDPRFGRRNNPDAEERIARLLERWRATGRPIYHVQHLGLTPRSAFAPGEPGCEIKPVVAPRPGEPVIQKHQNSAFIGTDLEPRLRAAGISTLVLTGLTTPHCVSSTARMAGNLGFTTYLVADATAANEGTVDYTWTDAPAALTDPELIHAVTLATLNGEFVRVVTSEEVMRGAND